MYCMESGEINSGNLKMFAESDIEVFDFMDYLKSRNELSKKNQQTINDGLYKISEILNKSLYLVYHTSDAIDMKNVENKIIFHLYAQNVDLIRSMKYPVQQIRDEIDIELEGSEKDGFNNSGVFDYICNDSNGVMVFGFNFEHNYIETCDFGHFDLYDIVEKVMSRIIYEVTKYQKAFNIKRINIPVHLQNCINIQYDTAQFELYKMRSKNALIKRNKDYDKLMNEISNKLKESEIEFLKSPYFWEFAEIFKPVKDENMIFVTRRPCKIYEAYIPEMFYTDGISGGKFKLKSGVHLAYIREMVVDFVNKTIIIDGYHPNFYPHYINKLNEFYSRTSDEILKDEIYIGGTMCWGNLKKYKPVFDLKSVLQIYNSLVNEMDIHTTGWFCMENPELFDRISTESIWLTYSDKSVERDQDTIHAELNTLANGNILEDYRNIQDQLNEPEPEEEYDDGYDDEEEERDPEF